MIFTEAVNRKTKSLMCGGKKESDMKGSRMTDNSLVRGTTEPSKLITEEDIDSESANSATNPQPDDWISYFLLIAIVLITIFTFPAECMGRVSIQKVWYFGWITAIATGLGVLPFYLVGKPNKYFMGIANALASGMMVAASTSLIVEGANFKEVSGYYGYHSLFRVSAGFILGVVFILSTKKILDQYEDLKFGAIEGAGAQKILLIVFVMTLHSLTEGIGIGVSFGGQSGRQLGQMISLSLALHNVPEGLAVALVLTSRGVPKIRSALWCIFTSIPQPLMAIPAFLFVERFLPVLPAGLGFASGAMLYVAIFELFCEAIEDTSLLTSGAISVMAFTVMMFAQEIVKVFVGEPNFSTEMIH